jgi:hypothetical protein
MAPTGSPSGSRTAPAVAPAPGRAGMGDWQFRPCPVYLLGSWVCPCRGVGAWGRLRRGRPDGEGCLPTARRTLPTRERPNNARRLSFIGGGSRLRRWHLSQMYIAEGQDAATSCAIRPSPPKVRLRQHTAAEEIAFYLKSQVAVLIIPNQSVALQDTITTSARAGLSLSAASKWTAGLSASRSKEMSCGLTCPWRPGRRRSRWPARVRCTVPDRSLTPLG